MQQVERPQENIAAKAAMASSMGTIGKSPPMTRMRTTTNVTLCRPMWRMWPFKFDQTALIK